MPLPSFSPSVSYARLSTLAFPLLVPVSKTLTTAGGVITLTVAELLGGLLRINCDDAQTLTLPTAALIVAGINGVQVGAAFDVDVINYGDTTLTIGLGTGVTKLTVGATAAVLTIVAAASKRLRFVITNNAVGSEAVEVYGFGSIAAAVA